MRGLKVRWAFILKWVALLCWRLTTFVRRATILNAVDVHWPHASEYVSYVCKWERACLRLRNCVSCMFTVHIYFLFLEFISYIICAFPRFVDKMMCRSNHVSCWISSSPSSPACSTRSANESNHSQEACSSGDQLTLEILTCLRQANNWKNVLFGLLCAARVSCRSCRWNKIKKAFSYRFAICSDADMILSL